MAPSAGSGTRLRRAAWSDRLTEPVARAIPEGRQPEALAIIKALHTLIFASVGAAIVLFVWDGLRQQTGRRAAYALSVVSVESLIYLSNNQVCPLTPLAEDLGAEDAHVADMFLPGWAARRIPVVGTAAALGGMALHLRAVLTRT